MNKENEISEKLKRGADEAIRMMAENKRLRSLNADLILALENVIESICATTTTSPNATKTDPYYHIRKAQELIKEARNE